MKIIIFTLFFFLIFSCSEKNYFPDQKYIGYSKYRSYFFEFKGDQFLFSDPNHLPQDSVIYTYTILNDEIILEKSLNETPKKENFDYRFFLQNR